MALRGFSISPAQLQKLYVHAKSAMKNAYAPYSRQKVGVAVLNNDGKIVVGCNMENAVNPASICAEQTALGQANAQGFKNIQAVLISGERDHSIPPCGLCRQVLSEHIGDKTPIFSVNKNGGVTAYTLDEILPFRYGPNDLP